jgi:hypothetical protein
LFPIYVGTLSASLLLLHAILLSNPVRELLHPPHPDESEPENPQPPENESIRVSLWADLKENINSNGGIVIWSFKVIRLLGVLILICLSVVSAINNPQSTHGSTLFAKFIEDLGKKRKGKGGKSRLSNAEWIELAWTAFYVNSL